MFMISSAQLQQLLDWQGVLAALHTAHLGQRPVGDSFFVGDAAFGLFSRGVISPGAGAGFKLATIHPANGQASPPRPSEQGIFLVVDEATKAITAALDGPEITRWKTAADSALAAQLLSREDSKTLLVLGAGPIARMLVAAFLHIRPSIERVLLWNRTPEKLKDIYADLQASNAEVSIVDDLDAAVAQADIISSATSSTVALIKQPHVRPGTHIDLVGGYRPDMQEAEAELFANAVIYVDDLNSALQSGDIQIPLSRSLLGQDQIGDLFDLCQGPRFVRADDAITIYKNAGGAHLDLAVSNYAISKLGHANDSRYPAIP